MFTVVWRCCLGQESISHQESIMKIHASCVVFVVVIAVKIQMIIAPGYNNNMYKYSTNSDQKKQYKPNSQIRFDQHPGYKTSGKKVHSSGTRNTISPVVQRMISQSYMNAEGLYSNQGTIQDKKPKVSYMKAFRITLFNEGIKTYILDRFTSCQNISAEIATNLGITMSSPLEFFLKEACSFVLFCAIKPVRESVGKVLFGSDYPD